MEAGLREVLLPPRKTQPEGAVQGGAGARHGVHGRGSAPWKRACGGRSCRPARHSPKGQCRKPQAAKRRLPCGAPSLCSLCGYHAPDKAKKRGFIAMPAKKTVKNDPHRQIACAGAPFGTRGRSIYQASYPFLDFDSAIIITSPHRRQRNIDTNPQASA